MEASFFKYITFLPSGTLWRRMKKVVLVPATRSPLPKARPPRSLTIMAVQSSLSVPATRWKYLRTWMVSLWQQHRKWGVSMCCYWSSGLWRQVFRGRRERLYRQEDVDGLVLQQSGISGWSGYDNGAVQGFRCLVQRERGTDVDGWALVWCPQRWQGHMRHPVTNWNQLWWIVGYHPWWCNRDWQWLQG